MVNDNEVDDFESEVLKRSKKCKFDEEIPFVGVATPDKSLNESYFKLTFHMMMHKIISFKVGEFLSYKAYADYFEKHVKEVVNETDRRFYYDGILVLLVKKERFKKTTRDALIPKAKDIIDKDRIFLKAWREKRKS